MFSASCCIFYVQFVFPEGEEDGRGVGLALEKAGENMEKQGEFSLWTAESAQMTTSAQNTAGPL